MNNLKSTISQVIEENLISTEWSDAVNEEVKDLNLSINDHLRKDLTNVPFVTIDGADAKDFDDAVFCNLNDSGFLLNVAIADVAELVSENSYLDQEAKKGEHQFTFHLKSYQCFQKKFPIIYVPWYQMKFEMFWCVK